MPTSFHETQSSILKIICNFHINNRGASLLEYALLLSLISTLSIFSIANIGKSGSNSFETIENTVKYVFNETYDPDKLPSELVTEDDETVETPPLDDTTPAEYSFVPLFENKVFDYDETQPYQFISVSEPFPVDMKFQITTGANYVRPCYKLTASSPMICQANEITIPRNAAQIGYKLTGSHTNQPTTISAIFSTDRDLSFDQKYTPNWSIHYPYLISLGSVFYSQSVTSNNFQIIQKMNVTFLESTRERYKLHFHASFSGGDNSDRMSQYIGVVTTNADQSIRYPTIIGQNSTVSSVTKNIYFYSDETDTIQLSSNFHFTYGAFNQTISYSDVYIENEDGTVHIPLNSFSHTHRH